MDARDSRLHGMVKADTSDRTVLQLSISKEDKRILAQTALDQNKSMAALVHEWIQSELAKESADVGVVD